MIKNIIFDFGRVIVDFDEDYMTSVYVSDPEDKKLVRETVFDRLYWDRLDSGDITNEELLSGVFSRLPERLHSSAQSVYEHWVENINIIPGMKELISSLKQQGRPLYLLSNISIDFALKYQRVPAIDEILSQFEGLVLSGPIHLVKPNPDIFEHLFSKYSLSPEECLFIDDNSKNIAAAAALGVGTYLFDGDVKRLGEFLKNI